MNLKISFKGILVALFVTLSLCIDLGYKPLPEWKCQSNTSEILWNLQSSLNGKELISSVLFCGVLLSFSYLGAKGMMKKRLLSVDIVNIVISIVSLMGEGYRKGGDVLDGLYATRGQCVKSIIFFIGMFFLLDLLSKYVYLFLHTKEEDSSLNEEEREIGEKWKYLTEKYPMITYFSIILICCIPHLIVAYPCYFNWDGYRQLGQYLGFTDWLDHHPIVATYIMGSIVKIGTLLGSGNFACFFFICIQAVIASLILAYSLRLMGKLNTPQWFINLILLVIIFNPYWYNYVCTIIKDTLYSYFFLLFIIELVYILLLKEDYFKNKKHIFLWIISVFMVLSFRHNGKYIVYPIILILTLIAIYKYKTKKEKMQWRYLFIVTPIVLFLCVRTGIKSHYNAKEGSIKEAIALPGQQIGRFLKYHTEDMSTKDKEILGTLYRESDKIGEKYNPRIYDPIKDLFKYSSTMEDKVSLLKIWSHLLQKHPLCCMEATVNQNYYLLNLTTKDSKIHNGICVKRIDVYPKITKLLNLYERDSFKRLKDKMVGYENFCFSFPIMGTLSCYTIYVILSLWICCFVLKSKRYNVLLVLLPILLSIIVVVLAPTIHGNPRYAFPIIFSLPTLIAYYMYSVKEERAL